MGGLEVRLSVQAFEVRDLRLDLRPLQALEVRLEVRLSVTESHYHLLSGHFRPLQATSG